jgi:hypothetical protein
VDLGRCKLCQQPGADTLVVVALSRFVTHTKSIKMHRGCVQGKTDFQLMDEILEKGLIG